MKREKLPERILTVILLLQAAAYYLVVARSEKIPTITPLATLPRSSGEWTVAAEYPIEKEVEDVLKADDTLSRAYTNRGGTASASLFIAFFKTQRYGQAPHSPKNCLPGSGWLPTRNRKLALTVPGRAEPIVVNEYVVSRGDLESVVMYWYQSHNRVIARETSAKFWLVADAIRYHRSDTALVRVVVPTTDGNGDVAERAAADFVRAVYPDIARQLPH